MIRQFSIRGRIWAIVVILVVTVIVGGTIDVSILRKALWQEKELQIRQRVESAFSVLVHYNELQKSGTLSESAAQAAAIGTIRAMRYESQDYVWLNDLGAPFPKMIMHPTIPKLDGQVLDDKAYNCATSFRPGSDGVFTPTDGRMNLFVAAIEAARRGGTGYVTYRWPKPKAGGGTTTTPYPKLSYVKKFDAWGWLVGSGAYVDDVNDTALTQAMLAALLVAGSSIVLVLIASTVARSIVGPLRAAVTGMRAIGKGEKGLTQRLPTDGPSEIAELSRGFNDMLERLEVHELEVTRQRETLEDEVTRRTTELSTANQQLESELAERIRVEQAKEKSEKTYRSLFDNMLNGFAYCRMIYEDERPVDFVFLGVNGAFEALTGLKDVIDRRVSELIPGLRESNPEVFEINGRVARGGAPETFETYMAPLQMWFSMSVYCPQSEHFIALFDDITERKLAEAALSESEARHRTVLAALGEGVYGVDSDGRCTFINRAAADMLGFPEAEVIGQDQHALFHHHLPDGQPYPHTECPIRKTVRDGQVRRQEEWFFRRDGTGFPVEMVATPLTEGEGLGGAVVAFRDITARRRAQDELRKLSLAVEQSPESIVITDLRARIEYVNEAFLRNTGYLRDEVIGRNPRILQSGKTPASTYEALWTALAQGFAWKGEFFNRRKDGSEYVELARIVPIHQADGRITHYVAVKEDITERKRIAAELDLHRDHLEELITERTAELGQARERAEAASRAKSAFLAAMSHEIRTPMNGVLGMIELLRQTEMSPDQRDMTETVGESARSLLGIIDDILDFSKIEAGKLALDLVPISVAQVVESVGEALVPVACKKNVELLVFTDPDIPQWVRADPVRLRQVLFNLASNAVKFTGTEQGKAGKVVIRADLMESAGNKTVVRMRVSDNGIGMSKDSVEGLFQPFTQAESSTTRRFGGTGLGLSISQRLTNLMGGSIEVDSTPGVGSVFDVVLELEVVDGASAADRAFDLDKLSVVVFAPDEEIREILIRYLEHSGAQVFAAHQADDAAKLAHAAMRAAMPGVIVVADIGSDQSAAATLRAKINETPALAAPRFVMIERGRRRTARTREPDSVIIDANAMRRAALLRAVAVAAGRASPEYAGEEAMPLLPASRVPSIDEAEAAGKLILVAEDNKTNQKVIERQLHMLGYAVHIANDGQEALGMAQRRRYGLVLTDCHMPHMDGFELTAALRHHEGDSTRIPIIAITANALKGEDQRCLAAGMDDYLSKPVQLVALRETLKKWLPAGVPAPSPVQPVAPAEPSTQMPPQPSAAAVNPDALKEIVGDDPDVVAEFLSDFVATAREAVAELQAAYAKRSSQDVGALAHKLKSSARTVGADTLADLCLELEQAGKAADWAVIDKAMPTLAPRFAAVEQFVETFVGQEA